MFKPLNIIHAKCDFKIIWKYLLLLHTTCKQTILQLYFICSFIHNSIGLPISRWWQEVSASHNLFPGNKDQFTWGKNSHFGIWTLCHYTPWESLLPKPPPPLFRFHPQHFQVFPNLKLIAWVVSQLFNVSVWQMGTWGCSMVCMGEKNFNLQ